MSRKPKEPEMTRKSARLSTRLFHVNQNSTLPKEESLIRSRPRRQADKPIIVLSSDSEEEYERLVNLKVPGTPLKQKCRTSELELNELSPVTPPKQKKTNSKILLLSPQHNKIEIGENVTNTPSSLLQKLALTSPLPKSNVRKVDTRKNRKSLFKENRKSQEEKPKTHHEEKPKLTDRKISHNVSKGGDGADINNKPSDLRKNIETIFQNAKRALYSTFPTDMPGREKEHKELRNFIMDHLEGKTSGSMYVSGPPGTGKTASLNLILEEVSISSEFHKVYVNCTAIKSASSIYARIARELKININGKTEKDYLFGVETYLKKKHKMVLLVLDEIDQLESKNQSILYTIFEWPSKPNSRLILIGIANALDLTDRTLPRLQARCELKPQLMHFAPYTKNQIVEIFTARLKTAGALEVFSPVALQMLAGKVAAVSGDVRRALDIGRRVIELIDQSKNEKILKPIENLANELVEKEHADSDKPKTVDLKQVVSVLNNVYGTSQNLTDEADDAFPLQQKIIVCSLVLILKKAKNKDVTVGKLHEVYRRVCLKRNILAVDQAEFAGLCSLIETRGIIRVSGKKETRLHKVNLEWDEEEVQAALKDKQLMSMILQDDSCLGKL